MSLTWTSLLQKNRFLILKMPNNFTFPVLGHSVCDFCCQSAQGNQQQGFPYRQKQIQPSFKVLADIFSQSWFNWCQALLFPPCQEDLSVIWALQESWSYLKMETKSYLQERSCLCSSWKLKQEIISLEKITFCYNSPNLTVPSMGGFYVLAFRVQLCRCISVLIYSESLISVWELWESLVPGD